VGFVEPIPNLRHRPSINEFAEDISKVRFGGDVLQLCRFDQRSNAGPVDSAPIVAVKPFFSASTSGVVSV
jgi:hypothetical protein